MAAAWQARAPGRLAVWEQNAEALSVFLAMGTQWRLAGLAGVPVGLDYAALPAVTQALGCALDEDLLARLRVMEAAAAEELRR